MRYKSTLIFNSEQEFLNEWYKYNKQDEEKEFREEGATEREINKWKQQWIQEEKNIFLKYYHEELENYFQLPTTLIIFRGLVINNYRFFVKNIHIVSRDLGRHWTSNKNIALKFTIREYLAHKDKIPIIITGKISKHQINWKQSILARTSIEHYWEEEIYLNAGVVPNDLKIEKIDNPTTPLFGKIII